MKVWANVVADVKKANIVASMLGGMILAITTSVGNEINV